MTTTGRPPREDETDVGAARPAVEGWLTIGPEPALLGSRCRACRAIAFPPLQSEPARCRDPHCQGAELETVRLSRRGRVWSYTDAQYQPPPPYIPPPGPYQPFALAAVELPEGITVLGQVAEGYGVADLQVGDTVELVTEPLYQDDAGDVLVWRWRPVARPEENPHG